jgi:hypothetical protein
MLGDDLHYRQAVGRLAIGVVALVRGQQHEQLLLGDDLGRLGEER